MSPRAAAAARSHGGTTSEQDRRDVLDLTRVRSIPALRCDIQRREAVVLTYTWICAVIEKPRDEPVVQCLGSHVQRRSLGSKAA